jgi:hypothetical protein
MEPPNNEFVSHSLPNNTNTGATSTAKTTANVNEKKQKSQASNEHSEGPRTPHSRAKNIARFYPVTKDTLVVKPDVSFYIEIRCEIICFFFLLDSGS